jgi:hypothetical protein
LLSRPSRDLLSGGIAEFGHFQPAHNASPHFEPKMRLENKAQNNPKQ